MTATYFANAIAAGLAEAMADDDSVIVIGEDVELSTIGATKGLVERFGKRRVRNSPISEATVVGSCVGAAACGLRPVLDLMFSSFFYVALDQVANQAARLRYMSGGQVSLPLVLFAGTGPSGSAAAQHSENPHPLLMSLSGVKVAFPSTPADAKALLIESIADPDPVVFLLDLMLAGSRGEVPDAACRCRWGRASSGAPGRTSRWWRSARPRPRPSRPPGNWPRPASRRRSSTRGRSCRSTGRSSTSPSAAPAPW